MSRSKQTRDQKQIQSSLQTPDKYAEKTRGRRPDADPDPVNHLSTSPVLLQSHTNYINQVIVLQNSGSDVTDNNNGGS